MDPIISQPEQSQYQVPTSEHKHFLNKKFIVTFVILLLLGGGAYAGIWYWQNQQLAKEVVPTFTPRADATADWKTYTNAQYGFEFKYPTAWRDVTSSDDIKFGALVRLRSTVLEIKSGGVTPEGVESKDFVSEGYEIVVGTQDKKKLVVDITKSIPDELVSTKLNIPNIVAYRTDDIGGLTAGPTVYIENPKDIKNYITISNYSVITPYIDSEKIFNQILSTFKFIDSGRVACTQEAKQCSDGSYVSRTGPNCEFAACPGDGTLTGHVTIGPNCPVEQAGNPCTPAPQAYTSRSVSVYKADGTTLVIMQNFDTQGNYNIALPAGTYVVKSRTGISSVASVVGTITVKSGQTSTLNFNIDTGIR